MPDRHAKPIEVLVRQLAENLDIDVVFGKALGVLGHAELFEPVCNLLHRGAKRVGNRSPSITEAARIAPSRQRGASRRP